MRTISHCAFIITAIIVCAIRWCTVVLTSKIRAWYNGLTPCCRRQPVKSGHGYPMVRCPVCDKLYIIKGD